MTQVPVLTLDRVLGDAIQGKKVLILVDIEGAEFMMMQGASLTLQNQPRPIWMMEISTTEHQPVGTFMNPNFLKTFELFFANGYRAYTANASAQELTKADLDDVVANRRQLGVHNFLFTVIESWSRAT